MRKFFPIIILFALLAPHSSYAQAETDSKAVLDSLNHYQKAYNKRIQELTEAELGETLEAIGKMSIRDTSVFTQDSLMRVVARGKKVIAEDKQAIHLKKKYLEWVERLNALRKED